MGLNEVIKRGDLRAVESAIGEGADIEERDEDGDTPLSYAIFQGLDMMKLLVDAGADVNARNVHDETPLFHAVPLDVERVSYLLSKGARTDVENDQGLTLVDKVYYHSPDSMLDIIRVLKRAGMECRFNGEIYEALYEDIREDCDAELLEWFLRGTKRNIEEDRDLFVEASSWELEVYLNLGMDPNTRDDRGMTAIQFSSREGYPETVSRLIKAGADINMLYHEQTPLMVALDNGPADEHQEIVLALLKAGAKLDLVDSDGDDALIIACKRKWKNDIIVELIARGADPGRVNKEGKTARIYMLENLRA